MQYIAKAGVAIAGELYDEASWVVFNSVRGVVTWLHTNSLKVFLERD